MRDVLDGGQHGPAGESTTGDAALPPSQPGAEDLLLPWVRFHRLMQSQAWKGLFFFPPKEAILNTLPP